MRRAKAEMAALEVKIESLRAPDECSSVSIAFPAGSMA